MPARRMMGRLSTAPTAAAMSAPITMASRTDMPKFVTSCAVANAPIAANDAWQSEMVPPTPVVSTTESRITAKRDAAGDQAQPEVVEHEQARRAGR